ncbi:MAG: hypothetical protein JKY65_11005 [Planctomycetes bacterium]|nr:hypothetical protein [Planctomycetota bacterium]
MSLLELSRMHAAGQRAESLDRLFALVDDHQVAGRFAEASAILDDANVAVLPLSLQLGLLTVSKPCQAKLGGAREWLFSRVRERLLAEEPGRCHDLLRGLA